METTVKLLKNPFTRIYKVSLCLDNGYIRVQDLIDILFSKARELKAHPYAIIPRDQKLLIYFKSREEDQV